MGALCLVLLFWQIYKTLVLSRYDSSKTVVENLRTANKYDILIRGEKIGMLIMFPLIFAAVTYMNAVFNAHAGYWVFMFCFFACITTFVLYYYRNFYKRHISAIRESLEELKDMEQ